MQNNITYDEFIYRMGFFRNKHNLSARDLSLQLGYSESEINRIERRVVKMKITTFIDFLNIINVSPIEFFYPQPSNYAKDMELLKLIFSLSDDSKDIIISLAKKLK